MVYLAVDIGASSGKIVKGFLKDGRVEMETVHRFPNGARRNGEGTLVWDLESLFSGIVEGLGKAGYADYVAIDTWGVDFVLLDEQGEIIGDTVSYRDERTDRLASWPDQRMLYGRTGIQFQRFNTIYQLLSLKEEHPDQLERARHMLFIPDYLSYRLTGVMKQEYTFASTTNLLDPGRRDWDRDLIDSLDLPSHLFMELSEPGTIAGRLKESIRDRIGYDPVVILAPSHDSASAVIGAYKGGDAMKANLSNEGGVDGSIRLLKNIMGTWMLQSLSRELGVSFNELEEEARKVRYAGTVDASDSRFLAPSSMKDEIERALGHRTGSTGEIASVVYHSLALAYRTAVEELEKITGRTFRHIAIVGGGANDDYLTVLTAMYTEKEVTAGPVEGTAIGNLLYQMIATGELSREDKNEVLRRSVRINQARRI